MSGRGSKRKASPTNVAKNNDGDVSAAKKVRASTITSRSEVSQQIIAQKVVLNIKWSDVANTLGKSKEWVTAACLGQMKLSEDDAKQIVSIFELNEEAFLWLQQSPSKGTLSSIPTDPCLYRFHEAMSIYGPALKELIHEEFGDGIMSAVDFTVKLAREENPAGDRVNINWSGKFLPYKSF